ncbi:trna pseudouridine synthase [Lucifera butyrica]|uniref:tRNA pseudouridine synthase A n=1 Tax=Lucifera butyrica TaxID=1351585 RepID=A0A498R0W4_9FIRM|nr:tRNA pseudouridine(38-40) synthase TruA [Lucifera butyrica]VBB04869.1 trna pseudouridine synthase [Lucifera butyrica]
MKNLKLILAYDGTAYHGFQRQANALTVQQVVEERLARIFGHKITLTGAARTDAGVHAYGQVVNFYTGGSIPVERIPAAAQGLLPRDIVVCSAEEVDADFHARYNAKSKIYQYKIYTGPIADPFLRNYAWHITRPLCVDTMDRVVSQVKGTHDFSAFRAAGSAPVNPVRTILDAACRNNGSMIEIMFWGTGFLYHMVRNLVGTLIDVGTGKITVDDFAAILAAKDRNAAGMTAPPQGLFLQRIFY